jgi:phosphoserine aminotransferase
MTRAFNFSAGPATLPESVLRQAQAVTNTRTFTQRSSPDPNPGFV